MPYNLDEATVRRLTSAALAAHPAGGGRFLALAIGPHVPLADVARTVERQVFEESADSDGGDPAAGYARHEDDSLFFLVLDRQTGLPAGAGRVVTGGGRALDDAPECIGVDLSVIVSTHEMYDGKIWDLASVALLPGYRGFGAGQQVSSLLYRTLCKAGRRAGVRHVVALLDARAARNLALLGAPLTPLASSLSFERHGSAGSRAVHLDFTALEAAIARQAAKLRDLRSPFAGDIAARGLRRLVLRRLAARTAEQVATGKGLDENILLPGLERRRSLIRQL